MTLNLPRILLLSLAGSSLLLGASPVSTNQGGPPVTKRNFTQQEIQQLLQSFGVTGATANTVSCYITNSSGATVTTISASDYASGPFYWVHYESGGVSSTDVSFALVPTFTGSPLAAIRLAFQPNSDTNIETPFGVPFWGENLTSGPWMLVVSNNSNQHAACPFTVTP